MKFQKNRYQKDRFAEKAKKENYKARSVFKLEEIDNDFKLIKSGMKVIDIGCYPGSFLQYVRKKIGRKGFLIGFDLTEVRDFKSGLNDPYTKTYVADLLSEEDEIEDIIETYKSNDEPLVFDLIISDAMGKTSGHSFLDHEESMDICYRVLEISEKYLKKHGNMLCKFFMGNNHKELVQSCQEVFNSVKIIKPDASMRSKKEFFILCQDKAY